MRLSQSFFTVGVAVTGLLLLRCGSTGDTSGLLDQPLDASSDGSSSTSSGSADGATADGSTDPLKDAAPGGNGGTTDAGGPGGTTTSLSCGSTACQIPGQVCCVDRVGAGAASYACFAGTTCPATDAGAADPPTALACSSAANCAAGTVCCIEQVQGVTTSSCKATCTGPNTAQLCDPKAAVSGCPADAGATSVCSSKDITDWGLPTTFATCGGRGN